MKLIIMYRNIEKVSHERFLKTLILVVVLLYIISPIDTVPGSIDDVIVALLGIATQKHLAAAE